MCVLQGRYLLCPQDLWMKKNAGDGRYINVRGSIPLKPGAPPPADGINQSSQG